MIIDAHIHYADDAPEFLGLLDELDLKLLNICFVHDEATPWHPQADLYRSMTEQRPDRFAWCTSFDLPIPGDIGFAERAIRSLEADFAAGAVACKVWKNIGMGVRRADGSCLMVDDPLFDPVFDYLAAADRTLLMHIAEPLACWQPLDPAGPHYNYYRDNPQWHMYNRPDMPSHAELIAARDRVLEKHPNLRIVGAHLASLEYDVDEVAARLDRYPNFAVDMSARL
ncbi:MAG TPA: amidohydrolase family protein, partial [Caldilineaceae bacterium]|nr:amidohydrolase family protein [Caldilineaceae bacterium]